MVNKGKDHLKLFIHKTGSAAQHKHDFILDQIFAGSPTDRQHIISMLALIDGTSVGKDIKDHYYGALLNYTATGDAVAARSGIYSHAYVAAVIAADQALNPVWTPDQTLLDVIAQTIKTIAAQANFTAFHVKQIINHHSLPFTFLDSLLTKIIPAHAPTAVQRDAA